MEYNCLMFNFTTLCCEYGSMQFSEILNFFELINYKLIINYKLYSLTTALRFTESCWKVCLDFLVVRCILNYCTIQEAFLVYIKYIKLEKGLVKNFFI